MKINKLLLTSIIGLLLLGYVNAQEIPEKIYKEMTFESNQVSKWFKYSSKSIYKYDDNGILKYNDIRGDGKYYTEYDNHGNEIYSKLRDCEGYTEYQYDSKGNIIYKKMNNTTDDFITETYREYDSGNRIIYEKQYSYNKGKEDKPSEHWYKYDKNGYLIYEKLTASYSSGFYEYYYENDTYGNHIHRSGTGVELFWEYKYDSEGRIIYFKEKNQEQWYSYNGNETFTCQRYLSGDKKTYTYENILISDNGKTKTIVKYFSVD